MQISYGTISVKLQYTLSIWLNNETAGMMEFQMFLNWKEKNLRLSKILISIQGFASNTIKSVCPTECLTDVLKKTFKTFFQIKKKVKNSIHPFENSSEAVFFFIPKMLSHVFPSSSVSKMTFSNFDNFLDVKRLFINDIALFSTIFDHIVTLSISKASKLSTQIWPLLVILWRHLGMTKMFY